MKMPLRKTTGVLVVILLFFDIFIFDFLSYPKQWIFGNALRMPSENSDTVALEKQIQDLQFEIKNIQKSKAATVGSQAFYPVHIFSTYPFNNKNLVVIDEGSRDGVTSTSPVTVFIGKEPVLFGEVIGVSANTSVVKTIFDSSWPGAVRVGDGRVSALLQGGMPPRVTLITKDKNVQKGDVVYSASKEFPYGLRLGTLGTITESSDGFYEEADLDIPYTLADIETVFVVKDYAR